MPLLAVPGPLRALFGRWRSLSARERRVIGLVGIAELLDSYDVGLFGLLLRQIQASLAISESDVGKLAALVRSGVVLSLGLAALADRWGRRRLLLATILGFALSTFATAFVQTALQFAAVQCLSRGFLYAETTLAVVVVAEELAADQRGFGIGVLGALGALGYGLAALGLGLVGNTPGAWRLLYAFGALPVLGLGWLRRTLPETARFERSPARGAPWWRSFAAFFTAAPRRAAALTALAFLLDLSLGSAAYLMAKTLQDVHGFSPQQVTLLYFGGGALAVAGNVRAGIWGDRFGRRPTLMVLLLATAAAYLGFYSLRGVWIPILWIVQVFALQGTTVLVQALSSELFATSYRSTASSLRTLASTAGAMLGLVAAKRLYGALGSHAAAISALLPGILPCIAIVWLALPETAGRELEEVSPERANS